MKKRIIFLSAIVTLVFFSSCAHRDCQGHKKTTKTAMGGWL
jgi:hypothetical protein